MNKRAALGCGASLTNPRPKVRPMIGSAATQSMGAPSFQPIHTVGKGDCDDGVRRRQLRFGSRCMADAKLYFLGSELAEQLNHLGLTVIRHHPGHPLALILVHQQLALPFGIREIPETFGNTRRRHELDVVADDIQCGGIDRPKPFSSLYSGGRAARSDDW